MDGPGRLDGPRPGTWSAARSHIGQVKIGLALAVALIACGKDLGNGTPTSTVEAFVAALEDNDFAAFTVLTHPPEQRSQLEEDHPEWLYGRWSRTPGWRDDSTWALLTSEETDEALLERLRPELPAYQDFFEQINGLLLFGVTLMVRGSEMSHDEKLQAEDALAALGTWLAEVDLTDETLAKKAIAVARRTARALGVKSIEELKALDFEETMEAQGLMSGAFKELLVIYGLDIDQVLDSAVVGNAVIEDGVAEVPITLTLLGEQMTLDVPLTEVDDRWYWVLKKP